MESRLLSRPRIAAAGVALASIFGGAMGTGQAQAATGVHGTTRTIQASTVTSGGSHTGSASTTDVGTQFPEIGPGGDGAGQTDRSHSEPGGVPVGAVTQPKPLTNSSPGLLAGFDGLNHNMERFNNDSNGNSFSLEPPDQGLCVGTDQNGHTAVMEVVNDVLQVYSTSGTPLLTRAKALNGFLGYAPAVVRDPDPTKTTFGPFVTDPSCIYDAQSGRWIVDVLTIDTFPHPDKELRQDFTGKNHLDMAVSKSSDPTAGPSGWTVYHIPVQDDGTDGTPDHGCQPNTDDTLIPPTNPNACLGDYPHIGMDANGVYLTTNEYSLFGVNFIGAQVYAISRSQLSSGSPTIAVTQYNTHGMDTFGFALNGFTLWPSTTPGGGGDPSAGGTEYFLSSNAAAEAHDTGDGSAPAQASSQLLVWALTGTSSLDSGGAPALSNAVLSVGTYAPPAQSVQKNGSAPEKDCLNQNRCAPALAGTTDPYAEREGNLDSNDSRMQQVTWVNGHLWGALDTGLKVSSSKQAGIEWFNTMPSTASGTVTASLANAGYVALGNENLDYPAIGLTSAGTGVMAFTLVGPDFYPSAGYATVDNSGVGTLHVAAAGAGPQDGFSEYRIFGPITPGVPRPRWGDYGAAVPWGSNVWIASEYIGQTCSFAEYLKTNFRCGQTRTALGNWDTRISEVAAP